MPNPQVGRVVPMRFIEPGLVNYADVGMVLVKKETLDAMLPSIVGKPIFNESHKDVSHDDFTDGKAQGIIAGNPHFDPSDGWFWVDGLIWDDETRENCKSGYSLSCAYDVKKWGPGGVHNNIPYDREVLEGEYTHLAIVNNPRYEGARLIINQGGHMKLKFWQKDEADKPKEVELTNSKVEVDGKEVGLEEIVKGFQAEQARQAELANANKKVGMEDVIEVDGKKVAIKDIVAGFQANLKNASEEAMEKAHKDGKHDDKEMDNCPMCNAEDKEEKEKKERENAEAKEKEKKEAEERENRKNDEEHEKGDHKEKPMENCISCKADAARKNAKHFDDLRNSRRNGEGDFREPGIKTSADRIAEGQARYGSSKS